MSGVVAATVVGAATTVYASNKQASAAKQQAAAQREATIANQRAASVSAQKERISAIRDALKRASQVSGAASSMGMGQASSGVAGTISTIGSQTASNIGFLNVQEKFAEIASQANQRAADAQAKMAKWQAIGSIGQQIMGAGLSRINPTGSSVGDVSKDTIKFG